MVDAEGMSQRTKNQENLQWYFKGYKDGVNVFLEEFWDPLQREDGPISGDKTAYLSKSRIQGQKDRDQESLAHQVSFEEPPPPQRVAFKVQVSKR